MDWANIIISTVSLLIGGGLAGLFTIKYERKKSAAEANQLETQVESSSIDNAKEIIELYKTSFQDMQELHAKRELELNNKYDELSAKFDKYKEDTQSQIRNLEKQITNLENNNNELKSAVNSNCGICKFFNECPKIKAINK